MKNLPIGFIDSGFGGLTVARQSLRQLPNESIIYFGDSARVPYGPRPLEEVKEYIWQMTNFLLAKGIKMLVIACNTGTAAALKEVREALSIPVIGVIHPGSRAAIKQTHNRRIGVIATEGTIKSQVYKQALLEKVENLTVYSMACPEFVTIVEENRVGDFETQGIVNERLKPFVDNGVDALILGCTHFPIMRGAIQEAVGESIQLIDSGVETINEVSTLLDYFGLSRTANDAKQFPSTQVFYTTGEVNHFAKVAKNWLHKETIEVIQCEVKGNVLIETNHSEP
ncbi:glutamate racemase [Fundicoccus culcitae]|uniref:Glutamate racemase n=1 Tax=Fundicoccus culcitae TaxID=2969821 RepID=A0ABY5P7K2_9LACT|nr:glutamate racemase [Fundicoccus culcitae]UUX34365.1 glutamate racemase [Fundicoccus culcitae]